MDGKQDYDVLGYIYEYLIGNFAANAGKKAGEFYTPQEVSLLMSEIVAEHLRDRKSIQIYDSTSGSGSLLINIGKSAAKYIEDENNIKYYAQELKQNTYNLTRMNLIMRGILPANIFTRNADTLEDDWPYFDESDPIGTYDPLYVDAVVSNPPYSQQWDPTDKESDARYSRFGLAPKGKADYAFLLHDLYHVRPDGIMTIILPHGVLFRGGEEGNIRRNLIENNHIDTIIGLPANVFFGTGIPTIIMVLKQKRENTDILIIDASKGFIKEGKNNKLQASDIRRIADTVKYREDREKFSRKVPREEIRANDYNLNIPRYVDSSERTESYDIYASMFGGIPKKEVEDLQAYWQAFPNLKEALFKEAGPEHLQLKCQDTKSAIAGSEDIGNFKESYKNAFIGFKEIMEDDLIRKMESLNIAKEKTSLAKEIFTRMENIPLIDEYKAYQLLDDQWVKISQDLEMIKSEGRSVITQVDANMVTKKRSDKELEVQEGWIGRIIPFELAQDIILQKEANSLKEKEERLNQLLSQEEEIFESFSEEDKEDLGNALNNDNTAFLAAGLNKLAKEYLSEQKENPYDEESLEYKVIKTKELIEEGRNLNREIKEEKDILHALTKEKIEGLDEDQANELLKNKWIKPLLDELSRLPEEVIERLSNKIGALAEKYSTTFAHVEEEIKKTEKELISFIDQLTGSDTDLQGLKELKSLLGGE